MTYKSIAKLNNSCSAITQSPSRTSLDLPARIKQALKENSIMRADLAKHVGCASGDIHSILSGSGCVDILMRVMDALKLDLTGIKPGLMLHQRLQATRESRNWPVAKLAERSGLSAATIDALEMGDGRVADLMIVLHILSPKVGIRSNSSRKIVADKDSCFTPKHIVDAIETAFGEIDLDPCAHPLSPVEAVRHICKADGEDGLAQKWSGPLVFVNPPYSCSSAWLRKVNVEWQAGEIDLMICLVNAKTDAPEFHDALSKGASVFFFKGRVKYVKPDGTKEPSSQPSMMIAYGTTSDQRNAFADLVEGSWVCPEA